MSNIDKKYVIHLDLINNIQNKKMRFSLSDNETSDFYIKITKSMEPIDLTDKTVTLYVVMPNKNVDYIIISIDTEYNDTNIFYCNLPSNFKNIKGTYYGQVVIEDTITEEKVVVPSKFSYIVESDIISETSEVVDTEENKNILDTILSDLTVLKANKEKGYNIDDTTASAITTYSGNKIENIKEDLSSQIKDIANNFTSEQNNNTFILKFKGTIIAQIPLGSSGTSEPSEPSTPSDDEIVVEIPETPAEVTPLSDFEHTWNVGANRVYLTDYLGSNTTVRISSTYTKNNSTLPTYYFKAFNGDTAIENIFYDEGVQLNQLETYAGCTSLKYLNRMLGGNLNRTFDNCTSLVVAPPWVSTSDIALYTYNNCTSLVNAPDMSASSVTTFNSTFYGCTALKSANIPTSATTLSATFYGCTALKNVTVNSENCEFISSTNAQTFKNTNQEIKIKVPSNSNTLTSLQNYIHYSCDNFGNLNVYDLNDNLITPISLWGDSLTKSPNGGIVNYSTTLLEKVGSKAIIYNFGVAGNTPSQILERQQSYSSRKNDIAIIWMGTNKDWNTIDDLINSINTAISYSSSKKYIVIGLVKQHATDEIDNAMANAFGDKFLNIRDYLIHNGIADAGLSATEQDTIDISNKVVPTSLMADSIHLTAKAQVLVGNQVYNKLIALGYLS